MSKDLHVVRFGEWRTWSRSSWIRGAIVIGLLLVVAVVAVAQVPFGFGGRGRGGEPVLRGMPDGNHGFTFCRLMYTTVRQDPSGSGWAIEYPRAEFNMMTRLSQFTLTPISTWANGNPGHTVILATDAELFQCPFVMMASAGTVGFSDEEGKALRDYLLKGGFLWADDFWGEASWNHWVSEMARILPEYQQIDVPPTDPLWSTFYFIKEIPQIPSLNRWRPGMSTSELGPESETVHLRGIYNENGRLMVLSTHNTDIADGWEREADLESYFLLFSAKAYTVGVNVAIWAMTH
jgi:hypothetical protein